jgi:site-specific recombinase XerD
LEIFPMKNTSTRGRRFPPTPVLPAQVRKMLDVCTKGDLGARNRAMLLTLQRSGVRVSELIALRTDSVSDGMLRVVGGKGCKSRVIGVDADTEVAIADWMRRREEHGVSPKASLFCTLQGKSLSPNGVRELLKRLARRAGVQSRVTPHQFRHGFAVWLARSGAVRLDQIQDFLAHESLETTEKYLRGLGGPAGIEDIRKVRWE